MAVEAQVAKTTPAWVIVNTPQSTAVIQPGHPSAQASAYQIDVPYASSAPTDAELDAAVQSFLGTQTLQVGTEIYAQLYGSMVAYAYTATLARQ
jgi:hypothetical protein